jgi:hypothetical protein
LAPAIAWVDGMPHLELIFLHSERADGCNARPVPAVPARPDLKIASTGCTSRSCAAWPCKCHADYFILHGTFSRVQIVLIFNGLLARPERFELPTPRFVVWMSVNGRTAAVSPRLRTRLGNLQRVFSLCSSEQRHPQDRSRLIIFESSQVNGWHGNDSHHTPCGP